MEFKAAEHWVKEINDRTVVGLAAVIGNVDSGYDRIQKGAFKKTIKENGARVRHLWMHDPMQVPTAVIKELKEVGVEELPEPVRQKYPEAKGGLLVAREYLNTPRGDELLTAIRAGAVGEMSFGYDPVKFDYEEVQDGEAKLMVRNLREIRLWDTSDVTWGMNAATVASKSALDTRIQELVVYAETLTKAGRVLSARNLQRLKDALAVLSEILNAAEPSDPEDDGGKALTDDILRRLAIAERDLFLVE